MSVTWTGSQLVLNGASPAPGFSAEIHDYDGRRVRVDFEGENDDARIEVRVEDGQVRVRID